MSINWKLFGLAGLAMLAFAGNSILNRFALATGEIGAWSFTLIRILSGTVILTCLSRFHVKNGSWAGAASLLAYAASFSFSYLALDAGLGALILFASVQFTMMARGIVAGERFGSVQWIGAVIALCAMIWLLWPASRDTGQLIPVWAVISMSIAGISWGVYSLIGRGETMPLLATTGNFTRAAVIALVISLPIFLALPEAQPTKIAMFAAITSGAITSALGYAIWYAALPRLSRMHAGVMQLSVPGLAALGGVLFLGEIMTPRLMISTTIILAGIGIATLSRRQ